MSKSSTRPKYCFFFRPIGRRLDQIFDLLRKVKHNEAHMSVELEALRTQVTALQVAVTEASTLLVELNTRLASVVLPQDLTGVTDSIRMATEALAAAVLANRTPV